MGKILVAYFSASENRITMKVAERLAGAVNAGLFEIKPREPYTAADINWMNPLSRCNREKLGKKDVPLAGKAGDISECGLILIGFPIWYGGAPNIVNSFVKAHDFTNKKIGLFATSGGSGMGKTPEKIKQLLPETAVIAGAERFESDVPTDELKRWAESLA